MQNESTTAQAAQLAHRVALFRHIEYGYLMVWARPNYADDSYCPTDYVRISEWQDVQFAALAGDEQIQGAITSLQNKRAEIAKQFAEKLANVDAQIANLRAITHQVAS